MNRYGQAITWGAISAPHLFTGDCTSYTARDAVTRQLIDDEAGDNLAVVLHSHKTELNFDAIVRAGSTDFLDLGAAGAALTVSGISTGAVLCSRAVERWALNQAKTASISATHFPDFATGGTAVDAGLSAYTPDQTALANVLVFPGSKIVYSTYGLGFASGIIHGLTIEQQLAITEDEPSPDGKILGAATHGYLRTINLDVLIRTDMNGGALPAVKSVLALTGAPDHAAGYRIESVEPKFALKRGKMVTINAVWIPTF